MAGRYRLLSDVTSKQAGAIGREEENREAVRAPE
jgi:hypothetical protein